LSEPAQDAAAPEAPRRRRSALSIAWKVAAVALAVAAIVWANQVGVENEQLLDAIARFGYPGLFVVSAISGFNVIIPIPAISLFPLLMQAGFHPVPTVLVIGAGMTVGDMVGFLLGRLGRKMVESGSWLRRLERIREGHRLAPYVLLFFYASFAPLPNELIVIPMALIGCRWYGVLGAALAGNLIFNALAAAGFHGFFELF